MKKLLLSAVSFFCLSASAQVYFEDDFNNPFAFSNWSMIDNDTDPAGNYDNWLNVELAVIFPDLGSGSAISISGDQQVIYTPDNILISPLVDLSSASATELNLLYEVGALLDAPNSNDHYSVYILTSNTLSAVLSATPLLSETLGDGISVYSRNIDLAAFAGQQVYIAFRHHNCSGEGTLILDNVSIENLPPLEVSVASVDVTRFVELGSTNTVNINVKNEGATDITDLTINWNDGTDHVGNISTLITPGATVSVPHPITITESTIVQKNIFVTITDINGGLDGDLSNNVGNTVFNTISQVPPRYVVLEEGTGTWCGWCPRGIIAMEEMLTNYPNDIIGSAVHCIGSDPMVAPPGYSGTFTSYPSFDIDRVYQGVYAEINTLEAYYNQQKSRKAPATLEGTLSLNGNAIVVEASSTFWSNLSGIDYRLAVLLTEDSVTGTTSGYAQANNFSGGSFGAVGGFELLPNPVPASDMVYNHVARTILGGYSGQIFSVPTSVSDGEDVNYTFNYNLPTTISIDVDNLHAYVLLIDQATGEIINAGPVQNTLSVAEAIQDIELSIFPNPSSEQLNVQFVSTGGEYFITLTDLQGRELSFIALNESSGVQKQTLDVSALASGNYILSVSNHLGSHSQMVTVK